MITPFYIKKYVFLILFYCLGTMLQGQTISNRQVEEGDSLLVQEWLLKAAQQSNQDSSFSLLENAFFLAKKLNFKKGKYQAAQLLADYHDQQGNLSAVLRYHIEALETLKEIDLPTLIIEQLLRTGKVYEQEKLYPNALTNYQEAHQLATQSKLTQEIIQINELIGNAYSNNNQIDSALYSYQKNVDFFAKAEMPEDLIRTYQKIVFNFLKDKNYTQSLAYNLKIKTLLEPDNNPERLAIIYNNIGYDYNAIQDYDKAIEYFKRVETTDEKGIYVDKATLYKHIGIAYHNNKELPTAIEYFKNAKKNTAEESKKSKAELNYLMASIYLNADDVYNALRYNTAAENIATKSGFPHLLVDVYENAAIINQKLYNYEEAFFYYKKHLSLRDSFQLEERIRQEQLLQHQSLLERSEKEIKLLLINQDVQNLQIGQLELERQKLKLSADNLILETVQQKNELSLLKSEEEIREANLKNKELQTLKAKQELALIKKNLEAEQQQGEISELQRVEAEQQLKLEQKEAKEKEQQQQIQLLNQQQEISQLELDKQASFRRFAYGTGGLLFFILCMILAGLLYSRKTNRKLAHQKEIIEEEKSKSETLLLNILPYETAKELIDKGSATPKNYETTTVLFSDFVGFTRISRYMTPEKLLEELNAYFIAFDEIMDNNNLEKIKTIGDAYMAVGGVPTPNSTHAVDALNAAMEMMKFHKKRLAEKRKQGIDYWDIRIGLHSGKLVTGVVGKNKFAYDIWGDTVNTASRMESNCDPGKINISDSTYNLVNHEFECAFRGELEVKNRGKVAMYFVEARSNEIQI